MTPPPDPGRAVAEARERLDGTVLTFTTWMDTRLRERFARELDAFEAAVQADERARLLSGQQDADAHGEALRRHQAGA